MSSIEFRKDLFADERDDSLNEIGKPAVRQDILGHVTGRSPFYDDHLFDGLLHMRCVRSPHHHARIRSIDASAAQRMPGVVRIVEAKDVPRNLNTLLSLLNFGRDDEPLIAPRKAAYVGEPVLAIIAESEAQARAAVAAVRVDWEVLPHVLDVEEALKPNAPSVNDVYPNNTFDYGPYDHQKLRFGDVERAFREAHHTVEAEYQMSPIEQAPMETCGAIAAPETNDRYVCYTSTQALFFSLGTTAKLLNMASSRLHFVGGTVGGGFGGKVDSIVEPMAVLGAVLTGRPVKFMWDREEEMQVGAPRGAERWRIKDGITRDGRIIARSFTGFFDAGAYIRLSSYAVQKATGHLPGPYTIPNVAANVFMVFTNRTPSTAMRGFGITAADYAIECHMDRGAEAVGMNPIEFRILNAYRDGDMKAHRRLAKNTALIECCQVAAQKAGWRIAPPHAQASSLVGGGTPDRAVIPETTTDQIGRIGERRRADLPTEPFAGNSARGRIPAGVAGKAIVAAPPQREDMATDLARMGIRKPAVPSTPSRASAPPDSNAYPTRPAAAATAQPQPAPLYTPAPPSTLPSVPILPAASSSPQSPVIPPSTPASGDQPPAYRPDQPFQQGVKRPGVSRFLSGTRRR